MGILLCRKKRRNGPLEEIQHELIINQKNVDVFKVKKQLKEMKNHLKTIKIVNCTSDRDRFESVDILLLREDLQVSDFPKLQSASIDFIRYKESSKQAPFNINNSDIKMVSSINQKQIKVPELKKNNNLFSQKTLAINEQQCQDYSVQSNQLLLKNVDSHIKDQFSREKLDDKLYEKALKTIQKDMKTHLLLRYTVSEEKLIINQLAFKDKRAFLYMMRKMKQLNCTLKTIVFKDIITLKKNIFITICLQMREIQYLEEIQIINTNLMSEQVYQLQNFLCWMQKQIKILIISGANLIDEHIDILFFQKFRINDFYALENLELKNCPQLWKSDKYMLLMKQYTQLKLHQNASNIRQSANKSLKDQKEQKEHSNQKELKSKSHQSSNKMVLAIQSEAQVKYDINKEQSSSNKNNQQERQNLSKKNFEKNMKTEGKVEFQEEIIEEQNKIVSINEINLQINVNKDTQIQPQVNNVIVNLPEQKNTISDEKIEEANIKQNTQEQKAIKITHENQQNSVETETTMQKEKQDIFESESRFKQMYSDKTYDNRHERQFLIGQFLWENQMQESYDENDLDTISNNGNKDNHLASSNFVIQGGNNSNIADKGMTQQDNQFFNQFFKQCIRDLMELDMCKIIDFSSLNYQNFNIDQKKQISQFIISSNAIQTFIIQYDRIFFKEFCELISHKYKTKRQRLFDSYEKELFKLMKSKNTEELNYHLENPQIFFNSNLKNNLFSLENITIIASKLDQFQFDSFCFMSFLSMFLLSIEIDFQKQQVEDQVIFPTHLQVLEYLRKMVEINRHDEFQNDNTNSNDEEEEASQDSDKEADNNNEIQNSEEKNTRKKFLNQQNNDEVVDLADQNKKIKNSHDKLKINSIHSKNTKNTYSLSSQIFEAIRNYQNLFDLQTSLQDFKLKNFTWKNAQGFNNDKSFSQFLFTYFSLNADSIMNLEFYNAQISHSSLSRLQEIIKIVFSKYKYYNEAENPDISTSILNYQETLQLNKLLQKNMQTSNLKFSQRNSVQTEKIKNFKGLNFMKTQKSILYNPSKLNSLQTFQQKNSMREDKQIQIARASGDSSNLKDNHQNIQKHQKSILEMSKSKTKSKYFLNKFKIKFIEKKIINVKQILNSFGKVCKYVEILNATCLDPYELEMIQQQEQQIAEQALSISKMQQSAKLANQQGVLENPNLLYQRAKIALNNLGQSNQFGNPSIINSSSVLKQSKDVSKNYQNTSNLTWEQGKSQEQGQSKNILSSIKLVDYIGFSLKDVLEINNQMDNIAELVLIRCRLQLQTFTQIAQKICSFKNLKKLVISGNNFSVQNQIIKNDVINNNLLRQASPDLKKSVLPNFDMKNDNQSPKKLFNFQNQKYQKQQLGNSIQLSYNYNQNDIAQSYANAIQEEGDVEKQTEEMFKLCIQNMLLIQNLKYLDLSNNELDECFGLVLCAELAKRSLSFLESKSKQQHINCSKQNNNLNQQNQQLNQNIQLNEIPSDDNQNQFSFYNLHQLQNQGSRKSGFYSKFIAQQLNSNVNQRNGLNGNKKFSKLRHLNTNFFIDNTDNQGNENQKVKSTQQLEKLTEQNILDDKVSDEEVKENYKKIKNINQEDDNNESPYQIQYTEDRILDPQQKSSERIYQNQAKENYFFADKDIQEYTSTFRHQKTSLKEQAPLIMNTKYTYKANRILANIPENEFERLESKSSQQHLHGNIQDNKNVFGGEDKKRGSKLDKEDLRVPDIFEFYLQNNNFQQKTIVNLMKHIGILFDKLKILDISAKSSNMNKKLKQNESISQSQQLQNKKNKFQINDSQHEKLNNQIDSDFLSGKSEQESSFEKDQQSIISSDQQSSIQSDSFIQNNILPNQINLNQQREQRLEKIFSSNSQHYFQNLEKLSIRDIGLSIFQQHSLIENVFSFPSIQQLDLSGCLESDKSVELLLQEVNAILVCQLKKINLSRNKNLKRASWKSLSVFFISEIKSVETLNLSDCQLNGDKIQGLIDGINELQNDCSLQELILARNIRLEGILKKFIFILTQMNYLHLQILDFSGCNLNDKSCENMIQGLLYGKKKRHEIINNYLLNIEDPQQKQEAFQQEFNNLIKDKDKQQKNSLTHSKSFQLIKLILYDNNISMKMQLLTQYCFVFQIQEEDNILFRMHFSSNEEQKKQMSKIWNNLKDKKGLIYSNLHHHLLEEYSVSSQTLVLGPNLFSSKKVAEDILLNCLRTFNSIRKLKLHVNDKIVSIMNGIANQEKIYGQDSGSVLEKSVAQNKQKISSVLSGQGSKQNNQLSVNNLTNQSESSSSTNYGKGFIIISHSQKRGSKKLTYIPRSRFEKKPHTQIQEKQPKIFQIDRQVTLPSDLNQNNNNNNNSKYLEKQRSNNNHLTFLQECSNNQNNYNQFGIKNRLQELSNQILQQKNENRGSFTVQGVDQNGGSQESIKNKKRSSSLLNQLFLKEALIKKQYKNSILSKSPMSRKSNQENTPQSLKKNMDNINGNFSSFLQEKEQILSHDVNQEVTTQQKDQFLQTNKHLIYEMSEQNSVINDLVLISNSEKQSSNEAALNNQAYHQNIKFQPQVTENVYLPQNQMAGKYFNYSFNFETQTNLEINNAHQIPSQKSHKKMIEINQKLDAKSQEQIFLQPQSPQKSKSIIKQNRSFLEADKDQQKQKSYNSPSFDVSNISHPQQLSSKSSFLFGKDSNVKKTLTIIDQPDKNQRIENIFNQNKTSFKSDGTQIQALEQITDSRNQTQNKDQINEQHIQQINDKINNLKYENNIIHLQDIESLILSSDEKVGIVNLLEFFSVIADNIKVIDFSKIIMSHSMFVRVAFRVLEIFENINQVKFANLQLHLNNEHLLQQTGQALHYLFTTPSIDKLEFLNCQITEQVIEYIIQPQDNQAENSFFVKEVNFSKNKNISFSKEENLILLENTEVLNLSDCNLNEKKINININAWKRDYLENLIDLDLSYNKGLSPTFFCNLGSYISKKKILQKLNVSYTGMYVEKQKQFSYGLHYKNGIHHLALQKLIIREMRFCKKEGTLMLFKALSKLPCLEVLDMSEMQVSNYQELDILHNYLRHQYIGKFTKVKKFYLQNCQFLFDVIPYYDFNSKYSLLEYNHFSLFLFTQFENIILLDLTGCLSLKKYSKKFLQELDVMRKKKLFNYTIKNLNISKNLISAEEIRDCVCNILFLFKNLQILSMRSLVHYEQNYVQNLLDALDSFSYFSFLQNQNYQDNKDAEQQGKEIAEAFLKIKNQPLDYQQPQEYKDSTNNVNNSSMQRDSNSSKFYSFNSSQLRQLNNQEGNIAISLSELVISDISNELIHNKGNIDMLLDTCVTNKIFSNLKKICIHAEYTEVTNLVRLQSLYNDSLLELNEKIEQQQIEPNSYFEIRFKFKESQQLIVLKPEKKKSQLNNIVNKDEKVLKKSIYFNSTIGQQSGGKDKDYKKSFTNILQKISQHGGNLSLAQDSPNILKQISFQSFTKMKLDYLDEVIEEEEDIQAQNSFKNSFLQEEANRNNQIRHSHFSINEQNEYLFHSFSSENEDDQIQIWRQFQQFLKKLSNPKLNNKTHISLNYKDPKLKLLSSQYNIFIDNKYELNTNMNILFNGIDSLYLGNMLYYFLVQICSFKPKADLIDFLINILIFISQNKFQDLTNKIIKLPPFLILNEEDASRIQAAFMSIQMFANQQKKMQNIINSIGQKEKLTFSQYAITPTKQISMQSRISNKDESGLTQQRNRLATQQKSYLDKKRLEYSSVTKLFLKGLSEKKKNVQSMGSYKNKIVCNYFYKSSQGCKEYIEIQKIKKMPPSTLNIENFSINGLKSVYMICYHNDYFIKGDIDYESIMFVSTSLAFSLREYFYQMYTSQKRFWFSSLFYRTMYFIMDIFVDIDSYFKYDESINALDRDLKGSKKSNYFFIFLIVMLHVIIYVLTPIFSFIDVGPYDNDHLSYIMHSVFALYAIVSFVFEIFCMRKVLILTRHLIPDINLINQNNLIAKVRDYVYEMIMNIEIFNYKDILFYQKIIFSFLSQLDAYQDICFILVTYNKEDYIITIFAIIVLSYTKFIEIILFFQMIQKRSYSNLFFYNTNIIYEYCQQTYLEGLSSILDVISPHNVIRITDNFFTSVFFPKKALGLTINKQIFHRIRKVVTCDLPQILLQIFYIQKNMSKQSTTVQLSIALNIISLIKSMYVLLTIKQSVLNQMDFDELSEQKSEFLQEQFLQYQHKEIEMFDKINYNVQQFEDKQQQGQGKSIASNDTNQDKNELLSSPNQHKTVKFEPSLQQDTIYQ